ncbi:hypothetical protein ACFLY2_02305 [Patescibacteria group bacterium]
MEKNQSQKQKNINVNYFKKMEDSATISTNIKNNISSLYNEELPFAAV